ncbi:hypothetical protein [Microbacterium enclense]|uniref:hypothetical protein n=1 Tax=Microbacterium enclense TaxID=993073 RepID=UPI003F80B706
MLKKGKSVIRAGAWAIMLGLAFFIMWSLIVQWDGRVPSTSDLVGTWELENANGHSVQMTLDDSGSATISGWPASLGCTEPLQRRTREVRRMRWVPVLTLGGAWRVDEGQQRVEVHARSVFADSCELWMPFYFKRNYLSGESRIDFYVASVDEPFLSEVLIFNRM